nr:cx9C motif-containing protein 4 isoform X1 [Rattus norvegicus]
MDGIDSLHHPRHLLPSHFRLGRVLSLLDMPRKDPCQKYACELQKCLQANNYSESRCQAALQELPRCCARFPKGVSPVCAGWEKEEEEKSVMGSGSE